MKSHPIQHAIYICSRFLAYGLPVLLFLVVNTFYLKTYDSAQIKITITQIGTISLMMVWFIKMLLEGRLPFKKSDLLYVTPFVLFFLSGLISFANTPFKPWSSEETSRRVFYVIIALITISEMRSSSNMDRLSRWLMLTAWFAVGYGVVQYLDFRFFKGQPSGIDPFIWRSAFGHRVFSTFGNPNFYGNFLVIIAPIALAHILKNGGAIHRPFSLLVVIVVLAILVDKLMIGFFGGIAPSWEIVLVAVIIGLLLLFLFLVFSSPNAKGTGLPAYFLFFSFLLLNLYGTETKGAWLGFTAAMGASLLLIFEYFLHLEDRVIPDGTYFKFLIGYGVAFTVLMLGMNYAFVLPLIQGTVKQVGFQILWIPTVIAMIVSVCVMLWIVKKPWNLKKIIYGALIFFILSMGGGVLQFAKTRLVSVSFRLFTWISTWEMIRTNPVLGNGVGTFKVIYPAYRRPEIIVLESKSNTETDHAEDEYLEIWQDEGIVGFGIFLWLAITAIVLGLKQLRWYSLLRVPDKSKKRKFFDVENNPRSYDVMGYLGAYIGALIHWFVDVSVRFVSSGVFSGFLPGVLVAYARNLHSPVEETPAQPYERWIRGLVAVQWVWVFLWLKLELVPQSFIQFGDTTTGQIVFWILLAGLLIFGLMELVEWKWSSENTSVLSGEAVLPEWNKKFLGLRIIAMAGVACFGLISIKYFGLHFHADVHHNMAIFFSKEGIWTKSPMYDAKMQNFPPDIRKKYQNTGGALEHYAEVNRKNHAFPMAYYFTGNVYNDWGSQIFSDSVNARNTGNLEEAKRLSEKALEMWTKSEDAYSHTKMLAPNYVQTHHQVGLLMLKRAEQANIAGNLNLAKTYFDEALRNFQHYRIIDPVFPPNYDRIAQILIMRGDYEECIRLYKQGMYYSDVTARGIHNNPFSDRLAPMALSVAKLNLTLANKKSKNPYDPLLPEVEEALTYFKMSAEHDPKSAEAWKGVGFVLERLGKQKEAQEAYLKAHALSPNDPSWQTVPAGR